MMFTQTGVEVTVDVSGSCWSGQLTLFLVGGGGYGNYGGGGSGYLQYQTIDVLGVTNIRLTVGDYREASSVIINDQTIVAEPGDNGGSSSYDGADGYSGGSGYCYTVSPCRGGSDGDDGDDGDFSGGRGTGEDISNYKLDHWVISPGAGGDGTVLGRCNDGYHRGGGGGGVLVNNAGPDHDVQDGEGYGGGGGWCADQQGYGQQGVILMEIVN